MSKPVFTINVTEEQFNRVMEKAKAAGLGPEALNGGTLPEEDGVKLAYTVGTPVGTPPAATIPVTFTILSKPFIVSAAFVQSKVQQMIAGA